MSDSKAKVHKLLRQQSAIASFGSFALREGDLMKILSEAARVCAEGLSVPYCKVCRYRPEENDLFIEAGFGWRDGVVGQVASRADGTSPQGRAFSTGGPSICNDLQLDKSFELPSFYLEHNIVSTVDVVIKGDDQPYGILEIDNDEQHDYDEHDIVFLTGFANVLAEAVSTSKRVATLQNTIEQMKVLVEDKDRLLDQKNVLAQELQHRVRNNLQLVSGMLSKQLDDTVDKAGRQGIKSIARRVSTLARVYDHLLGNEMAQAIDFGGYVDSLCLDLAEVQAPHGPGMTLACETEPLILDLDMVTALGLVITELVTNSYEHAFPGGKGTIKVSMHRDGPDSDTATLTVSDSGSGLRSGPENKRHGIGLVRRLIEQTRGTVKVCSNPGTVWAIIFPVAPRHADNGAAIQSDRQSAFDQLRLQGNDNRTAGELLHHKTDDTLTWSLSEAN